MSIITGTVGVTNLPSGLWLELIACGLLAVLWALREWWLRRRHGRIAQENCTLRKELNRAVDRLDEVDPVRFRKSLDELALTARGDEACDLILAYFDLQSVALDKAARSLAEHHIATSEANPQVLKHAQDIIAVALTAKPDNPKLTNLREELQNRLVRAEPPPKLAEPATFGTGDSTLRRMSKSYAERGQHDLAELTARRAATAALQSHGPQSIRYASALSRQALALQAMGRASEAVPQMRKAVDIAATCFGKAHPTYAVGLLNLARLLRQIDRPDMAEQHLLDALEINRARFGTTHPGYIAIHRELAALRQARQSELQNATNTQSARQSKLPGFLRFRPPRVLGA